MNKSFLLKLFHFFQLSSHQRWICGLFVLTLLIFTPCLFNDFTNWDDDWHLTANPMVRSFSWDNLQDVFSSYVVLTYIPLTIVSYMAEFHFFGLTPWVYHLTNILLHASVVVLVFLLGRRIGFSTIAAGAGSLIFAIHPMHVESVAWVSQRKDVLCAFFYLGAAIYYLKYLESGQARYYGFSLIVFFLSILSKPMAYSFPIVLWILEWFLKKKFNLWTFVSKIPYLALSFVVSWITFSKNWPVIEYSFKEVVLIWMWSFHFYLMKFFVPLNLWPLYPLPMPIEIGTRAYLSAVIGIIFMIIMLIRFRRDRGLVLAFLFYLGTIFFIVVRSVWSFGNASIVADRFMYIPSIALCWWVGTLFERMDIRLERFRIWARIMLAGVFIFLALQTVQQCRIWKNSLTLWSYVIDESPQQPIAYNNRGLFYKKAGSLDLALKDYTRAVELNPQFMEAYNNRANVLALQGRYQEALLDYDRVIAAWPKFYPARQNRDLVIQAMK